ncbi:MAG: SLC13 family permease [Bacillota bacterium]
MSLPVISLIALTIAVLISCFTPLNIGTLSLGLSFIVGVLMGGQKLKDVIAGYPTSLFLTLAGVTYLFAIAQVNGTLDKITKYTIKSVKGKVALLPIVLFFLAFILASIGPGHIAIAALLASPVMLLAEEVGIPPLLMALVVGNGAQAGAMSPIAPTGVIAKDILNKMPLGMGNTGVILWMNMLFTHMAVAALAYVLYGGLKLFKNQNTASIKALENIKVEPLDNKQWMTVGAIVLLIVAVIIGGFYPKQFPFDVGFGAFILGAALALLGAGDEGKAIKAMPWGTILMVTGVSVLVNLMSKIGGMDLFADIMTRFSTPVTVTLVVGFISAVISAYASTSGVIFPAILPLAPVLLAKLGVVNNYPALLALVSTIVVAGHLTDMSPLSTTGAVFIAQAGPKTDKNAIFRGMMIWGLSMAVVGAVLCWVLFGLIRLPWMV